MLIKTCIEKSGYMLLCSNALDSLSLSSSIYGFNLILIIFIIISYRKNSRRVVGEFRLYEGVLLR